jgi:hypothetical protein
MKEFNAEAIHFESASALDTPGHQARSTSYAAYIGLDVHNEGKLDTHLRETGDLFDQAFIHRNVFQQLHHPPSLLLHQRVVAGDEIARQVDEDPGVPGNALKTAFHEGGERDL